MESLRFYASLSNVKTPGPKLAAALAVIVLAVAAVGARSASPARTMHAERTAARASEASTNWAGYAVTSPDMTTPISFSSVTGTWTQATATCGTGDANAASAAWVGLGGYSLSSQAVEQIGTDADCNASGGSTYYAWYELVPAPPVNLTIKIHPGDVITTSVNVDGDNVVLQLIDRTRHVRFTKRSSMARPDTSSAEWIAEAPSSCTGFTCNPLPLANFGSVTFSRIAMIGDGHPGTLLDPSWTAVPLQLVPDGNGFGFFPGPYHGHGYGVQTSTAGTSAPGAVTLDGRSFTLNWVSDASESGASGASAASG